MDITAIPGHVIPAWAKYTATTGNAKLIDGLPKAQYHDTRALVSNSALSRFGDPNTPAHFKYWLDSPAEDQEAIRMRKDDALKIGDAFHALVLEPTLFASEYIQMPNFGNMQSPRNRELRDAWVEHEAAGRQPLYASEVAQIQAMKESLFRNKRMRRIIEKGRPEVTIVWIDPDTGILCKARLDFVSEIEGAAADLKSALTAHPTNWARAASDHRYHVQDSFYTRAATAVGIDIRNFVFAVVEKTPPYLVGPWVLNDLARMAGELTFSQELGQLRECITTNHWPGYSDDIGEVALPAWATRIVEQANR